MMENGELLGTEEDHVNVAGQEKDRRLKLLAQAPPPGPLAGSSLTPGPLGCPTICL